MSKSLRCPAVVIAIAINLVTATLRGQGNVRWKQPDFGTANLIGVDDKLLIQKTSGELVLAQASPDRFIQLATARIFPEGGVVQALPALSDGRLFVRDESKLVVLHVGR